MPYKNRKKEYAKRKRERLLDKLAQFEEFNKTILPQLRSMLREGAKSEDILEFSRAHAAARIVSIAATETDSTKALAASRDILDRTMGKAVERHEQTHKFAKLDDDALDALVISKLKEAELPELATNREESDDGDAENT